MKNRMFKKLLNNSLMLLRWKIKTVTKVMSRREFKSSTSMKIISQSKILIKMRQKTKNRKMKMLMGKRDMISNKCKTFSSSNSNSLMTLLPINITSINYPKARACQTGSPR
jgi:hypothetical protein